MWKKEFNLTAFITLYHMCSSVILKEHLQRAYAEIATGSHQVLEDPSFTLLDLCI